MENKPLSPGRAARHRHTAAKEFIVKDVAARLRLIPLNAWTLYFSLSRLTVCKSGDEIVHVLSKMGLLGFPALYYLAEQEGVDQMTMVEDLQMNVFSGRQAFDHIMDYLEAHIDELCPIKQLTA